MATEQLGVEIRTQQNIKWISLRSGFLCETSDKPKVEFVEASTKNKSGEVFNFYAKNYKNITGYITNIRKHSHDFKNGGSQTGWNVTIDTTKEIYTLFVSTKERPYANLMTVLLNINFNDPVRFTAFVDKRDQNMPKKVLLLYQGGEKPVQPKYQEKWLSRTLLKKLGANKVSREKGEAEIPLTEDEKKKLVLLPDGTVDNTYPYVTQNADEKSWSFDAWHNFLVDKMEEVVIPACQLAEDSRKAIRVMDQEASIETHEDSIPEFSGPPMDDDDIPF